MGRWGDGIYDSDTTLDFFGHIKNRLKWHLYYWMEANQVSTSTRWLRKVLTVLEVVLLFDKPEIGSHIPLWIYDDAVPRWKSTFFEVWDGKWDDPQDKRNPFYAHQYRANNTAIVKQWFDRIEEVATYIELESDDDLEEYPTLNDFKPQYSLPYFSLVFEDNNAGNKVALVDSFLIALLRIMEDTINKIVADENKDDVLTFLFSSEVEEIWVCIDVLATLGESYQLSPKITVDTVNNWKTKMIILWKEWWGIERIDDDELYKNVDVAFDRLIDVIKKYPVPSTFEHS